MESVHRGQKRFSIKIDAIFGFSVWQLLEKHHFCKFFVQLILLDKLMKKNDKWNKILWAIHLIFFGKNPAPYIFLNIYQNYNYTMK